MTTTALTLRATAAQVAAQATAIGREIHRLTAWQGLIIGGCGDYVADTGPVPIVAFDPANPTSGIVTLTTLASEETWQALVAAGGTLYVPYVDPRGSISTALAVATAPGAWTTHDVTPTPVHAMGVAVTTDGIFLTGASGTDGGGPSVWRSTDGGATWAEVLTSRPDPTNMGRFYTPIAFGDVVQVYSDWTGITYEWAGSAWVEVAGQPQHEVSDAVPFAYNGVAFCFCINAGKPEGTVQSSGWHVRTASADTASAAAITASIPAGQVRAACVDGGYLYVLYADRTLRRGDATGTWTTLLTADLLPASLAVLGGVAYFGTGDSKLYSTPIPA